MAVFESRECLALTWDHEGTVRSLRISYERGGKLLIRDAVSFPAATSLAETLAQALRKLEPKETQLILLGGDLPGTVCFDLNLPKMNSADLREAITYEIPRHLPMESDELLIGYRLIPDRAETGRTALRIVAVLERNWSALLAELAAAGVKADMLLPPYLLLDPLLADEDEIILPGIDPGFAFIRDQETPVLRKMQTITEESPPKAAELKEKLKKLRIITDELPSQLTAADAGNWLSAALLGAYGLSHCYRRDSSSLPTLPTTLIPERFRALRLSFFALLGFGGMLLLLLLGRYCLERRQQYFSLIEEKTKLLRASEEMAASNRRLSIMDELIQELADAKTGNSEVSRCLGLLNDALPKEMWLTSFAVRGRKLEINIRSTMADSRAVDLSMLDRSGLFRTRNSNKRRNADGSENIYLKIDYLAPGEDLEEDGDVAEN